MKVLLIVCTFLWAGMVLAISFVETPLKFTAPGITTQLGLGIGKVVFEALNKIEIIFSGTIIILLFSLKEKLTTNSLLFAIPIAALVIQTIWLLPILSTRVEALLEHKNVPDTNHHMMFVALEIIKVSSILLVGIVYIKNNLK